MSQSERKLGIIAGQGTLPKLIIDGAPGKYSHMHVLAFEGDTNPDILHKVPHSWLKAEEIARTLEIFKEEKVTDVVMAGKLSRPSLKKLKPPMLSAKIVTRLGKALFGGDDALFKGITRIFEEEGYTVVGANDILSSLLAPEGLMTNTAPNNSALEDVDRGFRVAKELGRLDIGQAVIVKGGQILGVEAIEGTDQLIARCATLGNTDEPGGVLIKTRKPGQEERVDLPTIGPETILNLAEAGFSGLAVEAKGCLILEKERVITLADEKGIFLQGFTDESSH